MFKRITFISILLVLGCEIPDQVYNDPLDLDYNASKGILPPALIFTPYQVNASSGSNTTLQVHALEVSDVAGAHIQIKYDQTKINVSSVSQGDWLVDGGQNPIFFSENNEATGLLDIYYSVLGDSEKLSGSGAIAYVVFTINAPGQITVEITDVTKIVDKDNQKIQLNGLGEVVINAQ